ncbi:MAG: hypothetical protein NTU85_00135 [Candidatus Kaiserbacteria bacterium]|nr:hypothetical protein [Candidatus Kaiserbacteria bacterium]
MARKPDRTELEATISALKSELTLRDSQYVQEIDSAKTVCIAEKAALQIQIDNAKAENEELNAEIEEKQNQLDRKETKKLAQAYEDQEVIYEIDAKSWLVRLTIVVGLLIVSTAISICLSSAKPWYDRFEYYLVDIIFLSAVWFCGTQYADQIKLKNDYANRKTIAQSFNNILNNLSEDLAIKNKFIEKATDVLCAPSPVSGKEPILSKKLIKDTAEILSSIKG